MIEKADSGVLPEGCRLVRLPMMKDRRGCLSFLQASSDIPFRIERVFWIWGVPEGQKRGGHAHRTCSEVVFPVTGAFTMYVDDRTQRTEVRMDDPSCGILIPAGMWCELSDFKTGTACVVVASHPYDADGYINTYEDYLKEGEVTK